MAKVLLALAVIATAQPVGQTFSGKYLFKLDANTAQIVEQPQAEFDGVADGTYSATCESLDASGAPMNDAVTCAVVVSTPATAPPPAPDNTYPAPAGLTATVTY